MPLESGLLLDRSGVRETVKAYGSSVDYGPTGTTKLMVRSILFFSQSVYLGVSNMTVSLGAEISTKPYIWFMTQIIVVV